MFWGHIEKILVDGQEVPDLGQYFLVWRYAHSTHDSHADPKICHPLTGPWNDKTNKRKGFYFFDVRKNRSIWVLRKNFPSCHMILATSTKWRISVHGILKIFDHEVYINLNPLSWPSKCSWSWRVSDKYTAFLHRFF